MRLGLGPVFAYEWLTATRRWQLYALRIGFLAVILMGMWLAWGPVQASTGPGRSVSIQMVSQYGEMLYEFVAAVELTLLLLAAPASTAGAVCLDKARGTLDHMLVTDLSDAEIVLGKLAVRLVPVLGLIACVVPLAALACLQVGWAIFVALLGRDNSTTVAVLLGSPLVGPAVISAALIGDLRPGHHIATFGLGAVFWIVAFGAGAAALFEETVSDFDRRLRGIPDTAGRLKMPERTGKPIHRGLTQRR